MNRRNFLGAMLTAASAPAIVKAEHLMKIVVPKQEIILPVKLRHQNGISGAHVLDMDINSMYDHIGIMYSDEQIRRARTSLDARVLSPNGTLVHPDPGKDFFIHRPAGFISLSSQETGRIQERIMRERGWKKSATGYVL